LLPRKLFGWDLRAGRAAVGRGAAAAADDDRRV